MAAASDKQDGGGSYERVKNLNRVRRLPKRADYDRETVHSILDAGMIAHVGFTEPGGSGQCFVIPMLYGREGDTLFLHGNISSRMLKSLSGVAAKAGKKSKEEGPGQTAEESKDGDKEQPLICASVTLVDGLVLARSLFHHSANYRSVVLFGKARNVDDEEEKRAAFKVITERLVPGRWEQGRQPNKTELKSTKVVRLDIVTASAKVREGPPGDDKADLEDERFGSMWAGVLPFTTSFGPPVADEHTPKDAKAPENVTNYKRQI